MTGASKRGSGGTTTAIARSPLVRWWSGRVSPVPALVLLALCAAHTALLLLWGSYGPMDIWVLEDETVYHETLTNLITSARVDGLLQLPAHLFRLNAHYSYAAHLPRAALGLLFGADPVFVRVCNLPYLALLLGSIYFLGRRLAGNGVGLLAMVLVAVTPGVIFGMRSVALDFPILAATPLAMLMLLRAEAFSRRLDSAFFGAAAGLSILLKGQAAFFILPAAAYELVRGALLARPAGRRAVLVRLLNGALALGGVLLITAPWWAAHAVHMADTLGAHLASRMVFYQGDLTLMGGVRTYLEAVPLILGGPMAAGLLLTLPLYLWRPGGRVVVLICWALVPLLPHVVLPLRHFRYVYPLVPALVLVVAVGLWRLPRWPRLGIGGLLVAANTALAVVCTIYRVPDLPPPVTCWQNDPAHRYLFHCGTCQYIRRPGAYGGTLDAVSRTYPTAIALANALGSRHPAGERALLVYPRESAAESDVYQLTSTLWGLMPRLSIWAMGAPSFRIRAGANPARVVPKACGDGALSCYMLTLGDEPRLINRGQGAVWRPLFRSTGMFRGGSLKVEPMTVALWRLLPGSARSTNPP